MENGVMIQYFEWYLKPDGTLWKKAAKNAQRLADRGVSSIWLPPAYKGQAGRNDVGYGVYDHYDLGEFDQKGTVATKYGTKQEYLDAIAALQKAGIQVYADIVLNHMMGADKTETVKAVENAPDNREEVISPAKNIDAWTRFTFPGRKGKYSSFTWDHTCFSGVDWDERKEKSAIYNFVGSPWSPHVDKENENYDYLMGANIDFSSEKVVEELDRWGQWYLDTTHVDGFRLDAVKHIEGAFFPHWLGKLRENNKEELFAVGEYWSSDINVLTEFMTGTGGCMSLFDVPLHFHFFMASHSDGNYDMRNLLKDTLLEKDPVHAVTFVDNHDTQPGQALESAVDPWFVPTAYAVILLRKEGYPCVFYGDYYGVPEKNGPSFSKQIDIMMDIRRNRLYGTQNDYFDDSSVVGWSVEGSVEHPDGFAVLLTDKIGGSKVMYVGACHAGEVWKDALGNCPEEVVIDEEGKGNFICMDGSVSVWCRKS